jgi:flagellar hook protein FlgE
MKESSNVDLGEEFVNLKTTQYAYLANLKTIKAEDAVLGTIFDSLA